MIQLTMSTPVVRSPHAFHLLIKPAGPACNLRCEYCFYLEKESYYPSPMGGITKMEPAVLEKMMEEVIHSQPEGVKEVLIGWQGGEPTLCGVDFFREVVAIQKKILPHGMSISNGFQTNGVLIDDEWATFFKENNFLVGISLDGPEALHDKFRHDAGGHGTHARVLKAIETLKRHEVEFNTLTCVQSDNADHAVKIYKYLKSIGSEFLQFIPIIETIDDKPGKVSSRTVSPAQWGRFMSQIFDEWKNGDIGNIFVQMFDSVLGGYMGVPGGVCVFNSQCGRSLVAEHNGDIYSCDHFVDPEHFLGNIMEKPLAKLLASPAQEIFGKSKETALPIKCKQCSYLQLCFGECPKNRIVKPVKGDGRVNWLCAGFKEFFKHSEKEFKAMAEALNHHQPAYEYKRFLKEAPGRNAPCPCGSGKKYKHCHGK